MRITYTLLSPTWGMHQYTADLANRMVRAGHDVHLVTTSHAPRDRYAPQVTIHTPVAATNTGFSVEGFRYSVAGIRVSSSTHRQLRPHLVHFTGPHLWNPLLLRSLRRAGVPTIHTLHDLHPHHGAAYGRLLYLWNDQVRRRADHLLVHGQRYRDELVRASVAPARITCTPLTHLFVGYEQERALVQSPPDVSYEPWALFLGRIEAYKGLDVLVEAARSLQGARIVIAGPGQLQEVVTGQLPDNIEPRQGLISDAEAIDLFRRCSIVVLPYIEASQSALVAAAYAFRKPVIVSRAGALPEYVVEGQTGWVVPPGDAPALARALQAALANPSRLAEMGQAGQAWYQRQRQEEMATLTTLYASLGPPSVPPVARKPQGGGQDLPPAPRGGD